MRAALTKFISAVLGAGLLAVAGQAAACNTGCAPPPPPTVPNNPTPPHTPCVSGGCGGGNHGGGGNSNNNYNSNTNNVNVNVNVKSGSSGSVFGSSAATSYVGGGYSNWSMGQGYPQTAGALNVVTGNEGGAFEAYSEERSMTRTMVLQASCLDDTGVPHPASQVSPDRDIAGGYSGEVYRCIAGTHMQLVMVNLDDCSPEALMENGGYSSSSSYRSSSSYESGGYQSAGYQTAQGQTAQGMGGQVISCEDALREGAPAGMCRPGDRVLRNANCGQGGYGPDGAPMPCGMPARGGAAHSGGYQSSSSAHQSGGYDAPRPVRTAVCHAGSRDLSHINWDNGKTMTCQKGEALWFEGGNVSCRVQIPQRQCNERSLLRRFGVGTKVITMTSSERITRQRQVAAQSSAYSYTTMTFDGGVGGFVQ